jgi:16S rRNA (cytosine1402-N4)-methyltransferase
MPDRELPAPGSAIPQPHVPVLLEPLLAAVAPVAGHWCDGTLGAGGYARGLIAAGAAHVTGIDRDPLAIAMAGSHPDPRLTVVQGTFSDLDLLAGGGLDGVVLDLGVSSMQLDEAARGFSFMKDGPLDMRMGQEGPTAADLLNAAPEAQIADILYLYGEETASRRIARAIVAARPLTGTLQLAEVIARCLPRPKPGQSHPATRSFQAIRIAVNAEFDELARGLAAAERALKPGGWLAVVTFHSLEDRIVKRFMQLGAGQGGTANRHAPATTEQAPRWQIATKKAIGPTEAEVARNPRARSARLRVARRTGAAPRPVATADLGLPELRKTRR